MRDLWRTDPWLVVFGWLVFLIGVVIGIGLGLLIAGTSP